MHVSIVCVYILHMLICSHDTIFLYRQHRSTYLPPLFTYIDRQLAIHGFQLRSRLIIHYYHGQPDIQPESQDIQRHPTNQPVSQSFKEPACLPTCLPFPSSITQSRLFAYFLPGLENIRIAHIYDQQYPSLHALPPYGSYELHLDRNHHPHAVVTSIILDRHGYRHSLVTLKVMHFPPQLSRQR